MMDIPFFRLEVIKVAMIFKGNNTMVALADTCITSLVSTKSINDLDYQYFDTLLVPIGADKDINR